MTLNSRSAKLSSPNVKVQDVPNVPTIGGVSQDPNLDAVNVSFTPAATGGRAAIYRALSNPGGLEGISYGSSPVQVSGLSDGVSYTFSVRGETSTGATTGYSELSQSITPSFSAMEFISTSIVSTSGVDTITFSNIPQTYRHLQLRGLQRWMNSGLSYSKIKLNDDSTVSNYSSHVMYRNGSSVSSTYSTGEPAMVFNDINGTDYGSGNYATFILDLNDYTSTTKYKTSRSMMGLSGGNSDTVRLVSGLWQGTAAVTSLSITVSGYSTFATGTRFSLYGLKG